MTKKKGRPARKQELTKRFQIRCTPAQYIAYALEAERRGLRRGSHDLGVGMLARQELDRAVAPKITDSSGRPIGESS